MMTPYCVTDDGNSTFKTNRSYVNKNHAKRNIDERLVGWSINIRVVWRLRVELGRSEDRLSAFEFCPCIHRRQYRGIWSWKVSTWNKCFVSNMAIISIMAMGNNDNNDDDDDDDDQYDNFAWEDRGSSKKIGLLMRCFCSVKFLNRMGIKADNGSVNKIHACSTRLSWGRLLNKP